MTTAEQRAVWSQKAATIDELYDNKVSTYRQQLYVLAHEMYPDVVLFSQLTNGQYVVVMAEHNKRLMEWMSNGN